MKETREARSREDDNARRRFILQIIPPGLVGLMDGSVSTLAPVVAAAFATLNETRASEIGFWANAADMGDSWYDAMAAFLAGNGARGGA